MPAITATAPGKVILFGEHAVVYGRPAIAAPVREVVARAVVRPEPRDPPGLVRIQAPAVGLEARLDELAPEHPLRRVVEETLAAVGLARLPACMLRITSTIPVASGLGSGAAVSVAAARALAGFARQPLPDERISAIAYEVEKLHHGTPSGIDNTVITYGMPVYFVRGQPIERFEVPAPFTLLIGDTGVASPTGAAVGDVRRGWQAEPGRFEALFDQVGELARQAREAIEAGEPEALGPLMDANQEALREMGVSSPELERLAAAAKQAGAAGAKLSGGGRGGNMIALVSDETAGRVREGLLAAGARRVIATTIGKRIHEGREEEQ